MVSKSPNWLGLGVTNHLLAGVILQVQDDEIQFRSNPIQDLTWLNVDPSSFLHMNLTPL